MIAIDHPIWSISQADFLPVLEQLLRLSHVPFEQRDVQDRHACVKNVPCRGSVCVAQSQTKHSGRARKNK